MCTATATLTEMSNVSVPITAIPIELSSLNVPATVRLIEISTLNVSTTDRLKEVAYVYPLSSISISVPTLAKSLQLKSR